MKEKKTVISAKNISIGYLENKHSKRKCLYENLSFELYEGELVCLLGANGAGKSTLLRTISTSQPTLNGNIELGGKDISKYSEKEISRLMGLVLTDKTSTGGLTVRELVELGRYPYSGFFGQMSINDKNIIARAIEDVGIADKKDSYISELSDGEKQKVMIAKTLAQECPIIILDEPTAFLDVKSSIEIIDLLHQLAINQKKTILLSTHNIDLALHLADRIWLLSRDNGLYYGVSEDVVLAGYLDNFFSSTNITFSNESGNFIPKPRGMKTAFIKADNNLYYYWTKNILARYNIQISDNKEYTNLEIEVHSPTSILLKAQNTDIEFNNYEQLSEWLRSNN